MTDNRWGAYPEEWQRFIDLGLTEYLLPVVSNVNAKISAKSDMAAVGKTPSKYNADGEVAGLPRWTESKTDAQQVAAWRKQLDYGFCIRTGEVCAIDVDIKDTTLAKTVADFISAQYKFPVRYRADSAKFLFFFRCKIDAKRVIRLSDVKGGPIIELLARGQQFIVAGCHADGDARYEIDWNGFDEIPELVLDEVDDLWQQLIDTFGVSSVEGSGGIRKGRSKTDKVTSDKVSDFLEKNSLVLDEGRNGELFIECPWIDGHSSDSGITQTAYFPPGGRGYQRGHFKCLHAGCAAHTDGDFMEALGYDPVQFDDLGEPEEVVEDVVTGDLPFDLPEFQRAKKKMLRGVKAITAEIDNVMLGIERPAFCRTTVEQNAFTEESTIKAIGSKKRRPLKDSDIIELRRHFEKNAFEPIGNQLMRDAVLAVGEKRMFDSAKDWLVNEVKAWDEVPRCEMFLTDYFGVKDSPYVRAVSRYIWSVLACRVIHPGTKADMVPIFVGKQGVGKSSGLIAMVPHEDMYGEVNLGDDNADIARMIKGKLIGEIAELAGLHNRDQENVKAFVSRQFDEWVPKYREHKTKYMRRLLFVGTTNEEEFLADKTGNRRWLPVRVTAVDRGKLKRDRDQLWAEARDTWRDAGVDWSAEKLAATAHDEHTISDPWEEAIESWLNEKDEMDDEIKTSPAERGFVTTIDVMQGALMISTKNCKKMEQMRVSAILRKLGWEKHTKYVDGVRTRGWTQNSAS